MTQDELTRVILQAQLDMPKSFITGTSNWAAFIAKRVKEAAQKVEEK